MKTWLWFRVPECNRLTFLSDKLKLCPLSPTFCIFHADISQTPGFAESSAGEKDWSLGFASAFNGTVSANCTAATTPLCHSSWCSGALEVVRLWSPTQSQYLRGKCSYFSKQMSTLFCDLSHVLNIGFGTGNPWRDSDGGWRYSHILLQ